MKIKTSLTICNAISLLVLSLLNFLSFKFFPEKILIGFTISLILVHFLALLIRSILCQKTIYNPLNDIENTLNTFSEGNFKKISFGIFRLMLSSFVVGTLLGIFFKPRAWCQVCPMGHGTGMIDNLIKKDKRKV